MKSKFLRAYKRKGRPFIITSQSHSVRVLQQRSYYRRRSFVDVEEALHAYFFYILYLVRRPFSHHLYLVYHLSLAHLRVRLIMMALKKSAKGGKKSISIPPSRRNTRSSNAMLEPLPPTQTELQEVEAPLYDVQEQEIRVPPRTTIKLKFCTVNIMELTLKLLMMSHKLTDNVMLFIENKHMFFLLHIKNLFDEYCLV
ncbi:hypothetical protein L7F22_010721 [Adiantum nelumboides]|nr:hypothetical protein [Adiantum nelumboides]